MEKRTVVTVGLVLERLKELRVELTLEEIARAEAEKGRIEAGYVVGRVARGRQRVRGAAAAAGDRRAARHAGKLGQEACERIQHVRMIMTRRR